MNDTEKLEAIVKRINELTTHIATNEVCVVDDEVIIVDTNHLLRRFTKRLAREINSIYMT